MKKKIYMILTVVAVSAIAVGCKDNSKKNIKTTTITYNYSQPETDEYTQYEKYFAWDGNTLMLMMPDYEKSKKIAVPKKCERIENMAFRNNENLEEVSFQDNKNVEGDEWGFEGCKNLKKIMLPENQKQINSYMFSGCSNLSEFTIPKAVESVGDYAFEYCDSLKEVSIGESVKTIGKYAFQHDESLEKVTFNNNLELIDEWAFDNCKALKEIRLNEGVKRIEYAAFGQCDSLTEIYLPESIEYINGTAFVQMKPHNCTVYLKEGSYAEKSFDESWGDDGYYVKQYY